MDRPKDKAGVERLRGTVNYLSRFLTKLSELMRTISNGLGTLSITALSKLKQTVTDSDIRYLVREGINLKNL